jgi:hypothetical protein
MASPVLVNGLTGVQATPIFVRGNEEIYVQGYHIFNTSNATAFVSFYDINVAPTVGTTVPKWIVVLPTLTAAWIDLQPAGLFFQTGLWVAAATTVNGNTNPSAALVINLAMS